MAASRKCRPLIAEGHGIKNCSSAPRLLGTSAWNVILAMPMPTEIRKASLAFPGRSRLNPQCKARWLNQMVGHTENAGDSCGATDQSRPVPSICRHRAGRIGTRVASAAGRRDVDRSGSTPRSLPTLPSPGSVRIRRALDQNKQRRLVGSSVNPRRQGGTHPKKRKQTPLKPSGYSNHPPLQKPNCFGPKVGARCGRFGADDPIETNSAGWA